MVQTFISLVYWSDYKLREVLGREVAKDIQQLVDYLYTSGGLGVNQQIRTFIFELWVEQEKSIGIGRCSCRVELLLSPLLRV